MSGEHANECNIFLTFLASNIAFEKNATVVRPYFDHIQGRRGSGASISTQNSSFGRHTFCVIKMQILNATKTVNYEQNTSIES